MDPATFHEFEHAGWQRAAEHYSGTFGGVTNQTTGALLNAVGVGPGTKLLDIATGPGHVAAAAAEQGAEVVGLDFSPAMIAEARRRHPALTFVEGDAERLQIPDRTFDAVVMNFGLLHLARPEAALAEAYRVLRPGGRYALTVWANPDAAVGFGIVLRTIERLGDTEVGLPEGPPFFRFADPEETKQRLQDAGFVHVEVRQLPIVWRLPSRDALFDAVSRGGVRTAALLRAQTPKALAEIQNGIREAVAAYERDGTIELPMGVMLASAMKASPDY